MIKTLAEGKEASLSTLEELIVTRILTKSSQLSLIKALTNTLQPKGT